MDDILKQGFELRDKAKAYGGRVVASDTLDGMFATLFNKLTLNWEVLACYRDIWAKVKLTDAAEIARIREENGERVISIQRMTFIEVMSGIEFSLKKYVAENPGKIGNIKGKVYLIKILNNCKDKDLLSESDYDRWDGLRELRNAIIHNNAISDVDLKSDYNNMVLELKRDESIQGNLFLFPTIIDWILDQVGDLALKLHTA